MHLAHNLFVRFVNNGISHYPGISTVVSPRGVTVLFSFRHQDGKIASQSHFSTGFGQ